MVYPRRDGSRSLAKFVALCAVTSCLLHGGVAAKIHKKQAPSVVSAAPTCQPLSEGDAAAGILIVSDSSCAAGGVGCIDNFCRFCKTKDTAESSQFIECAKVGWTPAPAVATSAPAVASVAPAPAVVSPASGSAATACTADPGDIDAGVNVFFDASCAQGGLGCLNDHCRHCKFKETALSAHLNGCDIYGQSTAAPPANAVTSAPVSPPVSPNSPAPPVSVPNADTGCPYDVSPGDYGVGIQLVGDATCANGGVGCFEGICRYCKFHETTQSGHLLGCDKLGYSFGGPVANPADVDGSGPVPAPSSPVTPPVVDTGCAYAVSEGDAAVGIQLVGDASCVSGGVGCFADVCRFCQVRSTPQSSHLIECTKLGIDFGAQPATTPAPAYTTTPVATLAPVPTTTTAPVTTPTLAPVATPTDAPASTPVATPASAPTFAPVDVEDPTVDPSTGCAYPVTEGDFKVGIQLVGDASCSAGGLGCFKDVCRYCQFRTTAQSGHLMSCKDLGFDFVGGSDASEPATDAPVAPDVDPMTGCPFPVSEGDFAVGIQLVGDSTCAHGGLGCFKNVCRFCKFQETPQSKHLMSCADFDYPRTESPAPTFAPVDIADPEPTGDDGSNSTPPDIYDGSNDDNTPEPTPADGTDEPPADGTDEPPTDGTDEPPTDATDEPPTDATDVPPTDATDTPPATNYGTGCPYPVSEGDFNVGIQLVGDASCVEGGLGCYKDVCRFCQFHKTAQSGHLMTCKGLGYDLGSGSDVSEPTTDEPTIPTADPATGCPYPVTDGDFAVGIQLVGDASCANGGLGCFKDVCRYCKFQETPQSKHLLNCSDFGYPHTSAPTFAPVDIEDPTVDPSTGCAYPVTEGDFKVGIQLVGDASCSAGGLGCFKDVCRYCQFRTTAQSGHLMSCKDLGFDFVGGSDASEPATDAPATTAPGAPANCPLSVTEGDLAVGVQLVSDASCVKGGLGCVADVCRFCKFRDTPQSSHLLDCAAFSTSKPSPSDGIPIGLPSDISAKCPFNASEGDLYIGVQIIEDTTCDIGGIGCFHDACRFCKFFDTDKSSHLEDCSTFGYNFEPIATTAAPRPGVTTAAPPATAPPAVVQPGACGQAASEGDKKAGIDIVADASCVNGGVGCVADSICRYCKIFESSANGHMEWCSTITGVAADTAAPVSTASSVPATPSPASGSVTQCDQSVSAGDKKAGIDMITDATCVIGGLGCLPDSACRYCKRAETAASGHLQWCPDVVISSSTAPAVATDAPAAQGTDSPVVATAAPAAPTTDASVPCTESVSQGDADQGIALATDPTCAQGGLGCVADSTCRYCKRWVTAASAHLEWCGGYDGYVPPPAVPDASPTTTPAPTLDATTCSTEVAPGDAEAGVAAVHDEQCVNGGIGCFGGVCRFCQVFESDKSAHLLPCASMVSTVAPLRFAGKVRTNGAKNQSQLDELFKNTTFQWSVAAAACVGVVAVVALFGLGAKRALTRKNSNPAAVEEVTKDTETTETDAATVAPTSSDSDDADADEVHV